jgi:nitroreductase / dihydropteridine reductase
MDFKDIVLQRYAAKRFHGKKVPDALISELLEMVRFAPSALNLQPWKIKVVTNEKVLEQLRPAANDQEQVTTCSHLLVFCAETDYPALIRRVDALMKSHGVPDARRKEVVGMAGKFSNLMSPEQRFSWSQAQTYLAVGNALNGAKALGLDSCPMGGFNPAEFTRILAIPKHLVPVILCAVGYGADKPGPKIRFAKEDILF